MEDILNNELLIQVAAIIGAIVTLASAIVKVTKTPNDDAIVAKILAVLEKFSIFNLKK